MQDFEKLGAFYLGKTFDADTDRITEDIVLYDSKDLTTHAVCVGMTGSGKTGLCLSLIEEAAIDGVPVLAIDPKGDLGNLMLTFPELRASDFEPWIDPDEAVRKGVTVAQRAQNVAESWKKGLTDWGQDGSRIQKFRDAADVAIYTPGSRAGIPLSVMRSLTAPPRAVAEDFEALTERVAATVSGLLTLLGIDADPVRSREHILLSNVVATAWAEGRDLSIADLIREVQSPPFKRIGVLDLESFFSAKDRFALAMSLNSILASPAFATWMEGEPLDIKRLLWTEAGKPRVSILSIAHLSDSQRMFFVTTLLSELIAWMRTQPGTTSLRAILYMDEVFGYFPPIANPPSKTPMLTLLKQARAFGVGCVLATQNPVDLDYKGLSNAGTWFLGRLQTERDKARVLEGLEGAANASGTNLDRQQIDRLLSDLGSRVFLLHNVHDDRPVLFHTRWVLSYLRGPLTRSQIEGLMADRKTTAPATAKKATVVHGQAAEPPVLPSQIEQRFEPLRKSLGDGERLIYRPVLFGHGEAHLVSTKDGVDEWRPFAYRVDVEDEVAADVWAESTAVTVDVRGLDKEPDDRGAFADLPRSLTQPKGYATFERRLKEHVYQDQSLTIHRCPELGQVSSPGENERDFRARLRLAMHERRDLEIERLRQRFRPKVTSLENRLLTARQRVEREKAQVKSQGFQTVVSIGTTILGALFGRKKLSAGNIGRAATAARGVGRVGREAGDVARAEETVEELERQLQELNDECQKDIDVLQRQLNADTVKVEQSEVKPRKSDITVHGVWLLWTPQGVDENGRPESLASA